MNLRSLRRAASLLLTVVAVTAVIASCNNKRLLGGYSTQDATIQAKNAQGIESAWLDCENSLSHDGFTVRLAANSSLASAGIEFNCENNEDGASVAIFNRQSEFSSIVARITPDDPSFVFESAQWSPAFETNSEAVRLVAPFRNSADFGICRRGLGIFENVAVGEPLLTVHFKKSADAPVWRNQSRAPKGDGNIVRHIDIFVDRDGRAHVSWNERNVGDYDNDGEVGVPDITPIAQYFGLTEGDILAKVDGNGDGEIGVPDITPIAENYGTLLYGYNVYRVEELSGSFTPTIRLPNIDRLTSLASIERPAPPISELFPSYEYVDRFPPEGRRFVYEVRSFDGVFEEGARSFPSATYSFTVESAPDWRDEQTVTSPFGHAVGVPAGGLPEDTILVIREVPEGEITEIPIAGADYINGVEVSAEDQSGQPVDFLSDVALTIPIPLGITSIQAVGGASGKSPSRVAAPDLLSVYQYNEQSHSFSEFAAAALNEDATAYTLTISEMGTYCLFGMLVLDYDPPVWLGAEGVQSVSVVGDNLVDVSFGTAQDTSDPVTYNVYFSTTTPVDLDTAQKLGGFLESPARIDAVRGAADYYFVVRAQDFVGNEEENTVETHVFVPRPNDSLFLTTDKGVYEVGEFIYLTANVKAVKNKVFQLNSVRVTFTPLIAAGAGMVTLGSFFDYHDGMFFPAPIIPVEGNPSFIEFNVSFAQASKEAPAGKSGDLFEFKFRTMKAGYLKFGLPADPAAPLNPYHFYTSVASKIPQRFTWLQGCSVKIVQPGSLPATGS